MNQYQIFMGTSQFLRGDIERTLRKLRHLDDLINESLKEMDQALDMYRNAAAAAKTARERKRPRSASSDLKSSEGQKQETVRARQLYEEHRDRAQKLNLLRLDLASDLTVCTEDLNRMLRGRIHRLEQVVGDERKC